MNDRTMHVVHSGEVPERVRQGVDVMVEYVKRDLQLDVDVKVRWFRLPYSARQYGGLFDQDEPDTIWLHADHDFRSAIITVAHELRHVWQWRTLGAVTDLNTTMVEMQRIHQRRDDDAYDYQNKIAADLGYPMLQRP